MQSCCTHAKHWSKQSQQQEAMLVETPLAACLLKWGVTSGIPQAHSPHLAGVAGVKADLRPVSHLDDCDQVCYTSSPEPRGSRRRGSPPASWRGCWPRWATRHPQDPKPSNLRPVLPQGLPAMRITSAELAALLAAVGEAAARGSVVAGELPAASRQAAADLLAGAGLLGRVLSLAEVRSLRSDVCSACVLKVHLHAEEDCQLARSAKGVLWGL